MFYGDKGDDGDLNSKTNDGFTNCSFYKCGRIVCMQQFGAISIGSNGVVSSLVPEGYRPTYTVKVISKVYNGSTYVDCAITIESSGTISILGLTGQPISGIQTNYLQSKAIMYMI